MESHPAAEVNVALCDPAAKNVNPFQMKGSCAAHTIESVDEVTGFTIKFNVAMESHPSAEVNVALCDPAAVNVRPFQLYGSCASQMVRSVVDASGGRMLKFSVMTESHPSELEKLIE